MTSDVLLGITVETELPDLEKQRQKLVVDNSGFKNSIADIENTLSACKVTSTEINRKLGEKSL